MKANKSSSARSVSLAGTVRPLRLSFFHHALVVAFKDKRGQVLPWVAFMMMLFLGMGAFVLDVGHGYICYRQLQAATDAAALAGAKEVYASTSVATAEVYAATTGGANTYNTLQNVTIVSGYPKLECLTTVQNMGVLCEGPNTANAIQVKETATIPTFFAQIFGVKNMNLTATSTAAKGTPIPLNVALLIDTTLSMNDYDSDCGATQMQCAMGGAQALLQSLSPSIDAVSVFTFPNVDPNTVSYDQTCAHGGAVGMPYSFPTLPNNNSTGYVPANGNGTYEVSGFSNDYRSSNSSKTPNTNSSLVQVLGAPSVNGSSATQGCLNPPSNAGNYGTYLAGTIYAAQAALGGELASELATNAVGTPTPINIMIILSDGNTNASMRYAGVGNQFFQTTPAATGVYPSDVGDCGQAVVAGQTARNNGTLIFAIAYGSPATGSFSWNPNDASDSINNAGCPTDQNSFFSAFHLGSNVSAYPNISPCQTMKDIASPDTAQIQFFYSDYNQSGSNSQCYSPNADSPTGLSDIFGDIGGSLSHARLIPDGTT
jgi:hypothetical protein